MISLILAGLCAWETICGIRSQSVREQMLPHSLPNLQTFIQRDRLGVEGGGGGVRVRRESNAAGEILLWCH